MLTRTWVHAWALTWVQIQMHMLNVNASEDVGVDVVVNSGVSVDLGSDVVLASHVNVVDAEVNAALWTQVRLTSQHHVMRQELMRVWTQI